MLLLVLDDFTIEGEKMLNLGSDSVQIVVLLSILVLLSISLSIINKWTNKKKQKLLKEESEARQEREKKRQSQTTLGTHFCELFEAHINDERVVIERYEYWVEAYRIFVGWNDPGAKTFATYKIPGYPIMVVTIDFFAEKPFIQVNYAENGHPAGSELYGIEDSTIMLVEIHLCDYLKERTKRGMFSRQKAQVY